MTPRTEVLLRRGGIATLSAPSRISALNDDLGHWYCDCNPDLSLCGRDLTGVPECDFEEADCVVCEAMVDSPCPHCGEEPDYDD